jgi:hypothetical protein
MPYSDNVTTVTWALRALVVLTAAVLVATAAAFAPSQHQRRVVFIALAGHGTITSKPTGLVCPGHCRAYFYKDEHVRLIAHPAAGWKLVKFWGTCKSKTAVCGFDLTDSHDCAGGMCPIGAFGEHVAFTRSDGTS